MQPDVDRQEAFWNSRAPDYPGGLATDYRRSMLARLERIPADARPIAGKRCLDIGAGTGVFSLYAAEVGADVTALDVSAEMLKRLRMGASERSIETVHADWREIDPNTRGWRQAFDIVFAQMVPSFRRPEDFQRMEACSRDWCVYIGWGRKRVDPWLQAAFALYDVPWTVPPGMPLALEILAELDRQLTPTWILETWHRDRSIESATDEASSHLFVRGVTADHTKLEELARRWDSEGKLNSEIDVEIGIIAWRPTDY